VVLTARGAPELEAAAAVLRAVHGDDRVTAVRADVTTATGAAEAVGACVARFGGLDALVANVGKGGVPGGPERPAAEWREALEVNLVGSMELAREAAPHLRRSCGSMVFVGSIAGVEDIGAPPAYAAAKAALHAAMKALARLMAPDVRVNAVAPGNVRFPGGSWERKLAEQPQQVDQMIRAHVPMQRFGTPEEIARVVAFLASSAASFITGSCVVVDGGQTRSW